MPSGCSSSANPSDMATTANLLAGYGAKPCRAFTIPRHRCGVDDVSTLTVSADVWQE